MLEPHLSFLLCSSSKLDLQAPFSPRFVQVWRCTNYTSVLKGQQLHRFISHCQFSSFQMMQKQSVVCGFQWRSVCGSSFDLDAQFELKLTSQSLHMCRVPSPSPSSPPSIARADLVAGTTVVSLLFLSFLKKNSYLYDLDRYLYNFLTFIIVCYYIVPWFWYPPPSALVRSMIRMWYIIFYNYLFHLVFMIIMPTNVTQMFLSRRYVNRKFEPTLLSRG